MNNKRFKTFLIIIICAGSLFSLSIVFFIFYGLNIFNLQENISNLSIIYISSFITLVDTILCVIFAYQANKKKLKTEITLSEILGGDINEAYNYGGIGLAVVNEEGTVLWTNVFLEQNKIDIVGKNIFSVDKKFVEFTKVDKIVEDIVYEVNNNVFEVKYLRSAGLFIFKDITNYDFLRRYSNEQSLCVGIILIDNYSDIVGNEDTVNESIQELKSLINSYAKKYKLLLRPYRNDAYFAVCTFKSLDEMKKDSFSIIDEARNLNIKEILKPTISIGFAYDFMDVIKLNEMASDAIDVAMSRGGDQAVIIKYGCEYEYFGGKTEAIESRSNVKIRSGADKLAYHIRKASNLLIMGHTEMDMDALGSCLGVKAFAKAYNKEAHIVFDSKLTERKTRIAINSLFTKQQFNDTFVTTNKVNNFINKDTLLVVCDANKPSITMAPELIDNVNNIVVIDHHRRADEFIENNIFSYIDTNSSSASEILTLMINYKTYNDVDNVKIVLDEVSATIMLAGIYLDTVSFKSKTTSYNTFESCMILKNFGASNIKADELLKDDFEEKTIINKIISTIKIPHYGVCYCLADENEIIERSTLAKAGNECVQYKGIDACFVIGKSDNNEVRISARSNGSVNVELIMKKLGGGGHFSKAACVLSEPTIEDAKNKLLDVLDNYLNEARVKEGDE